MNQISQWCFQHPYLAAFVAWSALVVIYYLFFNILQITNYVLARFQWWMIADRLRDKDGNITRENVENFRRLVGKIEEDDKQKKDKEGNS